MKVVPIKPGVDTTAKKEPDPELVAHFQALKEAAERGEIQAYVGGWVDADNSRDSYSFLPDEEWAPAVCFALRLVLNELENPFEPE